MKVIVRPRQCGKTTELLRYANEYKYVIITFNRREAERLSNLAEGHYPNIPKIVSAANWNPCCLKSMVMNGIVIDNAELVLMEFFADIMPSCMGNLAMITMNGVPEEEYDLEYDDLLD